LDFSFGFIKCQIAAACLGTLLEYGPAAHNNLPVGNVPTTRNRLAQEPRHSRFSCLLVFFFLCHHFQRFSSLIVRQSSQPYQFALGHLLPLPFVPLRLASVCSLMKTEGRFLVNARQKMTKDRLTA